VIDLVSNGNCSRYEPERSTTLSGVYAHARGSARFTILRRSMTYWFSWVCGSNKPGDVSWSVSFTTTRSSLLSLPIAWMCRLTWSGVSRGVLSGA
jgi:hypothetical protein